MQRYGILIDTTLCVGCYECENACAERWGFPPDADAHTLSSTQNTAINQCNEVYVPKMCMHCLEPTCVSVCPVGAFTKTAIGPVVYDADKCIGCRYCMQACPFDVPKYQWSSVVPKVTKCNLCYERISKGENPACVDACIPQARIFGTLESLIAEAKKRIADNAENYYPAVYGVNEAGGTSILYLANKQFAELGLKANLPLHPLPDLTWAILSKIPNYVFWGGTLLGGIWWLTQRKNEIRRLENSLKTMEELHPSSRLNNNNHS
ncbi:MAG: 4Fe-4S dicluster domain-containing protein [Bacteroidota bacterium]